MSIQQVSLTLYQGHAAVAEEIDAANDSLIRYRSYWEEFAAEPRTEVSGGAWRTLSPATAVAAAAAASAPRRR